MAATLIKKRQIEPLNIVDADIAAGANISTTKLADGANFIKRDGSVTFTADQSMGGFKLTNLAAPISANDAARLIDIQNATLGIIVKESVRVATTANITLSGLLTIDGITVVAGDRVLVKDQTNPVQNGIYIAATGAWARSPDADQDPELKPNTFVFVSQGTTQADTGWMITTDGTIIIGTTAITWTQFTGAAAIIAGTGLTKTGNTINVNTASTSRIIVNADDIDLALVNPGTTGNGFKIIVDNYGRVTDRQNLTYSDVGAQQASAELSAIASLSGTGVVVRTGTGAYTVRTISTASASRITVTNGNGVSGNPTVDLATSGVTAGTYNGITVDIYGRVTAATTGSFLDASRFIKREIPSGTINGVNTTFTLANTPLANKEEVFFNGVLQDVGAGNDYTISGNTITMLVPPETGTKIRVSYIY